jgi:hypothetical protein
MDQPWTNLSARLVLAGRRDGEPERLRQLVEGATAAVDEPVGAAQAP